MAQGSMSVMVQPNHEQDLFSLFTSPTLPLQKNIINGGAEEGEPFKRR